ncbi:MAG: aspartate-semialdehyde dehydrogenase [Rickettsiales bacterium]
MGYKVAVVGATGSVGREMLTILKEREFPVSEVVALASSSSVGKEVSFGDVHVLKVQDLEKYDFAGTDLALFSAGSSVSAVYGMKAADKGAIVVDNSSCFRMREDVPLVVPEVNPDALKLLEHTNLIANPNCSTIQMVVALKPLHDLFTITRIVVSTYQSVSGGGKKPMDELFVQTKGIYENRKLPPVNFTKQIAFNAIPHIDVFMETGETKEEWKMRVETQKILDPNIAVSASCVRIPVFVGHAETVNIECEKPVDVAAAADSLRRAPGVRYIDPESSQAYATQIECVREDEVFVSRLRRDSSANALNMWVVADNLRKGAALNSVQIAELVAKDYL